ncbi:hypothetical protein [Paenibacillus polymyxa]|uniref:Uncharacterized protein n=1 Tax=Paenibacillus polymyxa TaxID=1406 RepID=A0ABX2ZA79_PAEPO|nr:hypothetical protein [Paenibacillus polymyxa]ODA08223.1 hypothetical protein A7312_27850 [Paenibacillus polymyxa]
MSDALCNGLSSDNKLDWECSGCEEEFEVTVEFEPSYSAEKIVYHSCDMCDAKTRDIYEEERVFPFPKSLTGKKLCHRCWSEFYFKEMEESIK